LLLAKLDYSGALLKASFIFLFDRNFKGSDGINAALLNKRRQKRQNDDLTVI
jgi:hypothetical protein